jgi:NHL repeat-containing protein
MRRVRSSVLVAVVLVVLSAVLALPAAVSAAPKGVVSVFGSAGSGPGQFSATTTGLRAVAVDQASGDVYVVDGGNHRVQRFTSDGVFVSQLGSGSVGTAGGLFNSPYGVAVDPADSSVYVTDGLNLRVQKFSSTGSFIRAFGWDTIVAAGPPPNSNGTAFEVCDTTALIPNLASDCKNGVTGSGDGQFAGTHQFTGAPAIDPTTGSVYVADPGAAGVNGRRVQRFNGASGAFEGRWGGQGAALGQFGSYAPGPALAGAASPHRLAVDSTGAVYVVDKSRAGSGGRVQKCVPSGIPPAVTATCSLFATYGDGFDPIAIAIDPADDHVFVARRGGDNSAEFVIDEFAGGGGPVLDTHGVGIGIGQGLSASNTINVAAGLAVHGATGRVYFSIPAGTNPTTGVTTSPRVWVFDDVPAPSVTVGEPTDVTSTSATLHATIAPAATGPTGVRTFYRFEYSLNNGIDWAPATPSDVDLGNGSGSGDPASCPAGNPSTCDVSLNVTGLDPGEDYRVRVVARTEFGGAQVVVEGQGFATPSAPPLATTGPAMWSSPADTEPTLLLTGQVNPRGALATYRFEYVSESEFAQTGFDEADAIPVAAADAGAARRFLVVRRSVSGLDPGVGYRYRLTAANGAGPANGDARTVDPPDPGDRFYERVSDGDSWGMGLQPNLDSISDDGERAMFVAQGFDQPDSVPAATMAYIAERGESGWTTHAPFPPPERSYGEFNLVHQYMTAPDLGEVIAPEAERLQRPRAEVEWMRIGLDGTRTPVSGLIKPMSFTGNPAMGTNYQWMGAASDLSTFAFRYWEATSKVRLFADEQQVIRGIQASNLYAITGADTSSPSLSLVNREDGVAGAPIGGICGAGLGGRLHPTRDGNDTAYRAVSADGSVVYFSAAPGSTPDSVGNCRQESDSDAAPMRLFKRMDGVSTVAVSESQCARVSPVCEGEGHDEYKGASVDGEVVVFTSPRQLTDSDLDVNAFGRYCTGDFISASSCDLYVYDADPPAGEPTLVQASAGEATVEHPTVGSGAGVTNVLDVSEDGSRVYFTATGVLTGANARGAAPVAFQRNIYVYQRDDEHPEGRIEFVAPSVAEDLDARTGYNGFFAVDSDGGRLVFSTLASALPGEDGDAARDVYRYDDSTGELVCLSCVGDAGLDAQVRNRPPGYGYPDQAQRMRTVTPDGSAVVFATKETLVAADENTVTDVYLWREGQGLELVSAGTGSIGTAERIQAQSMTVPATQAFGISPDGDSVFFMTDAPLVASDGNNVPDLYVARVGGGFPAADTPPEPCAAVSGGCQGGGAGSIESSPATSSGGGGDVSPGQRLRLSVGLASSARARRVAVRRGVLGVRVRANRAGRVRLVARARIDGRTRRVGIRTVQLRRPGLAVVSVRLSRQARSQLRHRGALRVTVSAVAAGARQQKATVRLTGGRS